VRKLRGSVGSLGLSDHLCSGRPVTTTHNLSRQKVGELIQENQKISETVIAEKLNTGSASVRLLQVYVMPDPTLVLPLQQQ
jgi:hypothetical protein